MPREETPLAPERGVTAAEALVVAAILGLLSLVGVPSLIELVQSAEVRSTAGEVADGFRLARSQAIAEQRNVILVIHPRERQSAPQFCWQPPGDRVWALVEDVEGDCKVGASTPGVTSCSTDDVRLAGYGPIRRSRVDFVRVPLSAEPFDIGGPPGTARYRTLCFQPRGYVARDTDTGTGVYVGNPIKDIYRQVEVTIAGQVRMRSYRGGAYE